MNHRTCFAPFILIAFVFALALPAASLAADKKKAGGRIHFILLRKPGMPFVNGGVALECVQETIEALKA